MTIQKSRKFSKIVTYYTKISLEFKIIVQHFYHIYVYTYQNKYIYFIVIRKTLFKLAKIL
jgi:hypothetical protein